MEEWKDIPGYEGIYQASNIGRIRGVKRKLSNGRIRKERVLSPCFHPDRYATVSLSKMRKIKAHNVHRLVAITFIPNPFDKPQVNHIDGNKYNNRIENLEWVTVSENGIHAYKTGLSKAPQGERNGISKLTETEVREIRKKYRPYKYTYDKLGREYGVDFTTIRSIIKAETWSHI